MYSIYLCVCVSYCELHIHINIVCQCCILVKHTVTLDTRYLTCVVYRTRLYIDHIKAVSISLSYRNELSMAERRSVTDYRDLTGVEAECSWLGY